MNLKPIVASMILLGLSAPAFADYSGTGDAMNAQLNKMEAVINQNSAGNYGMAAPGSDWANRITVSGQANIEASFGNRTPNFSLSNPLVAAFFPTAATASGSVSNLSLNNANLFIDAQVSQWTKAHLSIEASSNVSRTFNMNPLIDGGANNGAFFVDEAYAVIGDLSQLPVYLKAGKEYVPFGVYDRNPMVMMPTQLLSETSNTAAQVGFVMPMGLYASLYGIDGVQTQGDVAAAKHNIRSGGADLGFATSNDAWGLLLDAGWIQNIENVNLLAQVYPTGYATNNGGIALSANGNIGLANSMGLDAKLRYVRAMNTLTTPFFTGGPNAAITTGTPSAYGIEAGLSFPVMNHNTRAALGWQGTNNAAGIFAKNMYYADYTLNVSRDTNVGVEVYNSRDYSSNTGNNATVGVVQLGVNLT